MAATRTWNTAYEATPADGDDARAGGNRIRDLKTDISDRMSLDHSWDPANADDDDDGLHKKVTLLEQAIAPASAANKGLLYVLDVAGVSELHWEDSAGNQWVMTNAGVAKFFSDVNAWTAGQSITTVALTDGATVTPNINNGNNFDWTIAGNRTLANPSNPTDGAVISIVILQDGTGSRIITYGSKWKFPTGVVTTLSTGPNDLDLITAVYNLGSDIWMANIAKNYV